jgi:hypothetical protein
MQTVRSTTDSVAGPSGKATSSTRRRFLGATLLLTVSAVALGGCCGALIKKDSAWKGTYQRYAVATRNAQGKRTVNVSSSGAATLIVGTNTVTYDLVYGANNANHIVQVYTWKTADLVPVGSGHDVKLTWVSMVKNPPTANYFADNVSPMMKVRGSGADRRIELEFADARGTRGDVDFSVGGKNMTGIGEADFGQ